MKDCLYFKGNVVAVPDARVIKVRILKGLHDAAYAGHVGGCRNVKNVSRVYWWLGMYSEYVKGCEVCQSNKGSQDSLLASLLFCPCLKRLWTG